MLSFKQYIELKCPSDDDELDDILKEAGVKTVSSL